MYNKLCRIKEELDNRHRDKDYLKIFYIEKRLTESLKSYYSDISKSVAYLENRKAENVVRKL